MTNDGYPASPTNIPLHKVHSINYIAAVAAVCVLGFPSEMNNVIGQVRREEELAISEELDRDQWYVKLHLCCELSRIFTQFSIPITLYETPLNVLSAA